MNEVNKLDRQGSARLGFVAVGLLALLYCLAYLRIYPLAGDATGALFLIPIAAGAWFFGWPGGFAVAMLGVPLGYALSGWAGAPPNFVGLGTGVVMGVFFGLGRNLAYKYQGQSRELQQARNEREAHGSLQSSAEAVARLRARQLGIVSSLGLSALQGARVDDILKAAAHGAAVGLDTDFADVLEYVPGSEKFVFRAIHGAGDDLLGRTLGAGKGSHSGYTLILGQPVIVEDYATDARFQIPVASKQYRLVSGASVVVGNGMGRPWGTFSVYTKARRVFSQDDIAFLQSLSNVIAGTIEWRNAEEARSALAHLSGVGALAVGAADEIMDALSPDGSVPRAIEAARRIRRAAANAPRVDDADRVVEEALTIALLRVPDAGIVATLDSGVGAGVSPGELAQMVLDLVAACGGPATLKTSSENGDFALEVVSSSLAVPASVRIAEARGGRLCVQSEAGRTSVRIVLPTIVPSLPRTAGGPAAR